MKKIFCLLLLFMVLNPLYAQNEKINREAFELKLVFDSLSYYEQTIEESPYFVKDNLLQIYPSEKLNIEIELRKDSIYSMHVVKENLNPERTVVIEFSQDVRGENEKLMMLKTKNPFDLTLHFKAYMFVVNGEHWIPTSIIPVQPKISGYEIWHDVIITMALDEWILKKEK